MRLHYLELIGSYKGLKNQVFDFRDSDSDIIALVGLNGAGKSNFLELVAEIFCFLERHQRVDFKSPKTFGFNFEIFYSITNYIGVTKKYKVVWNDRHLTIFVKITHPDPEPPSYPPDEDFSEIPLEALDLPNQIIGYSSGLNENLQRPFLKNITHYYDALLFRRRVMLEFQEKLNSQETFEDAETLRIRYKMGFPHLFQNERAYTRPPLATLIDYDSTALLVASLTTLPPDELEGFCAQIGYHSISSFTLAFNLRGRPYTDDEERVLSDLIHVAKHHGEVTNPVQQIRCYSIDTELTEENIDFEEELYEQGKLSIDVNQASDTLSTTYPLGPSSFFSKLHKVQLLGTKNWQASDKKNLRKDDFYEPVRKPIRQKLPLEVTKLIFLKEDGTQVNFFDLSDGETQLIQTLAALRVFNTETTLFLLDEPDTHLNPHWRTEFHKNLEQIRNLEGDFSKDHQIFISTHSPFMLSSLDKSSVYQFKRNEDDLNITQAEEQTFGSSFEFLSKTFFDMNSLISSTAIDEINAKIAEYQNSPTQAVQWIEEHVGESMEKSFIVNRLSE
ncbi:AAA family ATPase [Rubritalea sp.]|uniref:AAA family ATPase n=1 Tax=Rubritalea sp. TaxID=2109375 RepID=UPI003EF3FB1E